MKIHRLLLFTTMLVATILFADGILALGNYRIYNRPKFNDLANDENYRVDDFDQIERLSPAEPQAEQQAQLREENTGAPQRPVNLLILGLDAEEARSDVMVLLNFSPVQSKLNILSIARDTRVYVKGKPVKINALMATGGEKMAVDGVEKLTGLKVDYYVTLNFEGFRKVIDTLGGVEIDVPMNMDYDDPEQNLHIHLKRGLQVLNGSKAEQFVRYRKGNRKGQGYEDGDIGRIRMQQELIKALAQQKVKFKYLSKIDDIFRILKDYMKTNIEMGDISYYLKSLRNLKFDEIQAYTTPGDSAYIDKVWYFIVDRGQTKSLIRSKLFR